MPFLPHTARFVPFVMGLLVLLPMLAGGPAHAAKPLKVVFTTDIRDRKSSVVPLGPFTIRAGLSGGHGATHVCLTSLHVEVKSDGFGHAKVLFSGQGLQQGLARAVNLSGNEPFRRHVVSIFLKHVGNGMVTLEVAILQPTSANLDGIRVVTTGGTLGRGSDGKPHCQSSFDLGPFDVYIGCSGVSMGIPRDPKKKPTPARITSMGVEVKGQEHGSAKFEFPRPAMLTEGIVKVATLKDRDGTAQRCTLEVLGAGAGWITVALSFEAM